ncbi:MAG: hypothetical protein M1333_03290 [Patescibacteria group bacterium]|nr:hypothetical protein [Patescibacteria group bacterium]
MREGKNPNELRGSYRERLLFLADTANQAYEGCTNRTPEVEDGFDAVAAMFQVISHDITAGELGSIEEYLAKYEARVQDLINKIKASNQ